MPLALQPVGGPVCKLVLGGGPDPDTGDNCSDHHPDEDDRQPTSTSRCLVDVDVPPTECLGHAGSMRVTSLFRLPSFACRTSCCCPPSTSPTARQFGWSRATPGQRRRTATQWPRR